MAEDKPKKPIRLQIEVEPEVGAGKYANATMVHTNENEFVLDFIFIQPQTPKARVGNRVVLAPRNAKRLAQMLTQNLRSYEERFGEIKIGPADKKDLDFVH